MPASARALASRSVRRCTLGSIPVATSLRAASRSCLASCKDNEWEGSERYKLLFPREDVREAPPLAAVGIDENEQSQLTRELVWFLRGLGFCDGSV